MNIEISKETKEFIDYLKNLIIWKRKQVFISLSHIEYENKEKINRFDAVINLSDEILSYIDLYIKTNGDIVEELNLKKHKNK
jgi:hypothetical protein